MLYDEEKLREGTLRFLRTRTYTEGEIRTLQSWISWPLPWSWLSLGSTAAAAASAFALRRHRLGLLIAFGGATVGASLCQSAARASLQRDPTWRPWVMPSVYYGTSVLDPRIYNGPLAERLRGTIWYYATSMLRGAAAGLFVGYIATLPRWGIHPSLSARPLRLQLQRERQRLWERFMDRLHVRERTGPLSGEEAREAGQEALRMQHRAASAAYARRAQGAAGQVGGGADAVERNSSPVSKRNRDIMADGGASSMGGKDFGKCVLIGQQAVGKTCIMKRFCFNRFNEHYKVTLGADFGTKVIAVNQVTATAQVWDTAGQERFNSLGQAFYRGADACLLVYDVTDRRTLEELPRWKATFVRQAGVHDEGSFPFIVLGNKCDLESSKQEVSASEGEAWARANGCQQHYRVSALDGTNIEQAFLRAMELVLERKQDADEEDIGIADTVNIDQSVEPPKSGCCGGSA